MTGVICTPLRAEYRALQHKISTALVRTGSGPGATLPVSAAGRPALVAGVAGSLRSGVHAGDLVVADRVVSDDGTETVCRSAPFLAGSLRRRGLRAQVGGLVSRSAVVDGPARATLAAQSAALAVDTESAYLAAQGYESPFAAVRAITDTPDTGLISWGTPIRGIGALHKLRGAAPVLQAWARAAIDRHVLLAAPRSFCAGVERAIEVVERALATHTPPVYVRRQIVHNSHVVADLERRGAVFVGELDEVPAGAVTVLSAHGVSPGVRAEAGERGLQVIDATCPLVAKVHNEVRRFAARDNTVLLIGHHDHEEVVGTRGEAPENVIVVAGPEEAATVQVPDHRRVAYTMQTTLAVEEAMRTVDVLQGRFPELTGPRKDDICYATTNRQHAVRAIAARSELVLVLGSQNSSNSHRLAEVAEAAGARAELIEDPTAVDLDWLAGTTRVGITAGASAPPHLVDDLVWCLSGLGQTTVEETATVSEDVRFTLPREVS